MALILCYHHIKVSSANFKNVGPSLAQFGRQLELLKHLSKPKNLSVVADTNRGFGISFDDGYLNNRLAIELAVSKNIPITLFATTFNIESQTLFYWDSVRILNSSANEESARELNAITKELGVQIPNLIETIAACDVDCRKELSRRLQRAVFADPSLNHAEIKSQFQPMKIDDIVDISKNSLVNVGSHTESHGSLGMMQESQIELEISTAVDKLTEWTGKDVSHFAYPFGTVLDIPRGKSLRMKDLGCRYCWTTHGECLTYRNDGDLLPRKVISTNKVKEFGIEMLRTKARSIANNSFWND